MQQAKNSTTKPLFEFGGWAEAFDSLDIGISVISPAHRLEYINESYRRLVGIPDEIQLGTPAFDMYLLIAKRGDLGEGDPEELANKRLRELSNGSWSAIVHNSNPGNVCKVDRSVIDGGYIVSSVTDITRNVEYEAMLSSVLDAADRAIMIVNKVGTVEYVNDAYEDMFEEAVELKQESPTYFDYFMNSWKSGNFHCVHKGNDCDSMSEEAFLAGATKMYQDSFVEPQAIKLDNDRYVKLSSKLINGERSILLFTDNTDSVLREQEVKIAQEKSQNELGDFQIAFDNMDVGLVLVDRNLNVLLINDTFHGLWNINPERTHIGEKLRNLFDYNRSKGIYDVKDDDWESYVEARLAEIAAGDIEAREFARADDTILIYSCTALSDGKRLLKYSDITGFKKREQELENAQSVAVTRLEDFSAALNNMDLGLVLLDRDLNTLIVNQAFHDIWHTDTDAFPVGTPFRALMDYNRYNGIMDIDDAEWEEHIQSRLEELRQGDVLPRELNRADGHVQIYAATTLSSGHKLVSYKNITEFKKREAALENAQFQAESADRSKSEFLANMSHEIRTPMNGVMGMAELLSKTELSTKQQMFTDVILSSSTALLTIINDILDFSKIEAGKLELDLAPFRLSSAIEDIATLVSTTVAEKGLELIVRIQPDLGDNVVGDVGRFRQIITNLLGNAVKFTETGHVLVDVSGEVNDGIVDLKCSVQDTGIGIPEDQVNSVFEKFSQVDGSSTRRHEGTGLGLAIAARLVALMDGEIGCSSGLGEGSTFWFTAKMPVDKNARPSMPAPIDVSGARVLAIDDNSVNRSILLEQFEAWKLVGKAAASGLEGLAMLRQSVHEGQPYDAIVLDFHMPDMNGLDVARVIRSDELLKETPIVMLTSVDNISDNQQFKMLDIDAHLTKPARASQLLECIVDILQDTHMAENAAILQQNSVEEHAEYDHSVPPIAPFIAPGAEVKSVTIERTAAPGAVSANRWQETAPKTLRNDVREIIARAESGPESGICILVAEDNEVNQMVFTQILDYMDYEFKIVENGALAVEEVVAHRPQIILMDVSMPVMNGLDATREIRRLFDGAQSEDGYRPAIIGVTAHALKDDRDTCFAAGMDDYLSKPISPDKLSEKIRYWLSSMDQDKARLSG